MPTNKRDRTKKKFVEKVQVENFTDKKIVLKDGMVIKPNTISSFVYVNEVERVLKGMNLKGVKKDRVLTVGTQKVSEESLVIGKEQLALINKEVTEMLKERTDLIKTEKIKSDFVNFQIEDLKEIQRDLAVKADGKDGEMSHSDIIKSINGMRRSYALYLETRPTKKV
jgi:hypothetical protein